MFRRYANLAAIGLIAAATWAMDATAQQIADGVICSSAKLRFAGHGRVQLYDYGDCARTNDQVQTLAVDLTKAKVEPVMSGSGPGYPLTLLVGLTSTRRSTPPCDAVAAVNGGFFYPYVGTVSSYSWVVDINGRAHPPASMRIDQQCRANRRSQLTLALAGGDQLPFIQPHAAPASSTGMRIVGGGGRILPTIDSGSPLSPCPCAPTGPCNTDPNPDDKWSTGRARTAVGFRSGEIPPRLYITTVKEPPGITIPQLADVFRTMTGADQAIALDGGGSTQMWIRDTATGGSHRFGGSRLLASALLVYADPVRPAPSPPPPPPSPTPLGCDPHRPPANQDKRAWCAYGRCVGQAVHQGAISAHDRQQAENAAWNVARRAPFTYGYNGGNCSVY